MNQVTHPTTGVRTIFDLPTDTAAKPTTSNIHTIFDPPTAAKPERGFLIGQGNLLGRAKPLPPTPLSDEEEMDVLGKIMLLAGGGTVEKTEELVSDLLRAPQSELRSWATDFSQIPQEMERRRSIGLAVLVKKHLEPAIKKAQDAEKAELEKWKRECCEILQQSLPWDQTVEECLFRGDLGVREERLMLEKAAMYNEAERVETAMLQRFNQKIHAKIDGVEERLVDEAGSLRQTQRDVNSMAHRDAMALTEQVEQLETASGDIEFHRQLVADQNPGFEARKEDCAQIVRRLI